MTSTVKKTLTVIVGAGPGTGQALGVAFSKVTDAVALLARNKDSLQTVAEAIRSEGGVAEPFSCDATSRSSLESAFADIKAKFPDHGVQVACYNANPPYFVKPFLDVKIEEIQPGMNVAFYGAFHFSQVVIPLMLENGSGTLIFTGATAALRGGANFTSIAPSKFALRALSQTLAREFHHQGVHVAHSIIDGYVDTARITAMAGEGKPGERLSPAAIAQAYVFLHQQDRSAWTQELDLRPFSEKF